MFTDSLVVTDLLVWYECFPDSKKGKDQNKSLQAMMLEETGHNSTFTSTRKWKI